MTGTFAATNGLNIGGNEILNVIYGSTFVELATAYTATTDLWLGGADVWSNGTKWSIGEPAAVFDVVIYSGGNDNVTLDVGSTAINSLAVGGPTNNFTSVLTDNGVAQSLSITKGLTVGQQGTLSFTGNGSSITAATVANNGNVTIGTGATLNLTNQPLGVTDVVAGSRWTIGGNFAVGGVANTGFANLATVGGTVIFEDGQSQTIDPLLTIASSGSLDVSNGTTLTVMADVNNSGTVSTGRFGTDGNTLGISGALTNTGTFQLNGPGDMATGSSLTNNVGGFVDVEHGSTLNITGNVTNSAGATGFGIYTSFNGTGNNTLNINGNLTNNGTFGLESTGDKATISGNVTNGGSALFALTGGSMATFGGTLANSGTVDLENASTLQVNGAASNSGILSTSGNGGTGGNTHELHRTADQYVRRSDCSERSQRHA